MRRGRELAERIEGIRARVGTPLGAADVPGDEPDPLVYFTDEDGRWDHEEYARVLVEERGSAGPAWVALSELDEIQDRLDHLEERYRQLWERLDAGGPGESDRRAFAPIAERIADGGYVDPRVFDSIRAQLVALGELDVAAADSA